jgi:hypothetical protein
MKKKILLSVLGTVLTVGVLIAIDANKSINLLSIDGSILENATALAYGECGGDSSKSIGSPLSGKCNTPMSTDNNRKCSTSIITCQGSSSCCERRTCSLHN